MSLMLAEDESASERMTAYLPKAEEFVTETIVPTVRERVVKNPILSMVVAMLLSQMFPRFSKAILGAGLYFGIKNAGGIQKII